MKSRSLSLLLASVFCLGLANCDERTTSPDTSNNGGKTPGVLADNCVNAFAGITSCGVGGATLLSTPSGIMVTGLPPSGTGGVSSSFASAVDWTQSVNLTLPLQGTVNYDAVSGGQVVSSANVMRIGNEMLGFQTRFTGSSAGTYDIAIYDGANYVGGLARQIGGGVTTQPLQPGCWMWRRNSFRSRDLGRCVWEWVWVQPCRIIFRLPDGTTLLGDRLVFTENIDNGHYPYRNFERIGVRTNASEFQITAESTIPAAG